MGDGLLDAGDATLGRSRRIAAGQAKRLLGIERLTEEALFEVARSALAPGRAERCLALARLAPLSRRGAVTSAIAALIVGTRALGPEWWSTIHEEFTSDRRWIERGIPDDLLAGNQDASRDHAGSYLPILGNWVADDAADARWGGPIDVVDLNDPRTDDRVVLPTGAKPGDCFVASWDVGGRIDVHVVERTTPADPIAERQGLRRGRLGSRLGKDRYHDAAEAEWAWAMATDTGPIRLPGEIAHEPTDPFAATVDPAVAERLRAWAVENGATAEQLGSAWRTKGDLWSARFRLGLPYNRPGTWWGFDRAVTAVVDDDDGAKLTQALV